MLRQIQHDSAWDDPKTQETQEIQGTNPVQIAIQVPLRNPLRQRVLAAAGEDQLAQRALLQRLPVLGAGSWVNSEVMNCVLV